MSFFEELKRRNVIRAAVAYAATAWLLIQVAETLMPLFGIGLDAVRTISILLACGFVPVLVLSWFFDISRQGLVRELTPAEAMATPRPPTRAFDRAIVLLLVAAIGYFAVDKFIFQPQRDQQIAETAADDARAAALIDALPDQSIAVLPFADMSDDASQEYFADGISEELLHSLASIPELRVASRTSSFALKDTNLTAGEIHERLKVGHILEGSVRKSGEQMRITAQLIDAKSDAHIWSETYDRTVDDLFAIQQDLAQQVASRLRVSLVLKDVHEPLPKAYALYLRAAHLRQLSTRESLDEAVNLLQRAIEIDPAYARLWSLLSVVYMDQGRLQFLPENKAHQLRRLAIQEAINIDDEYGEAHARMGLILLADNDLHGAAGHFEKALRYAPTDFVTLGETASFLMWLGRLDQAIAVMNFTARRDPTDAVAQSNLADMYLRNGQWDQALVHTEQAILLSPEMPINAYFKGIAHLHRGEPKLALAAFKSESDEEYRVKGMAMAYHSLGDFERYEAHLDELVNGWGERWPSEIAHVHTWVGDHDAALEWLEKDLRETGNGGWLGVATNPFLRPLRENPRWLDLLEQAGVAPQQLEDIQIDVDLPVSGFETA